MKLRITTLVAFVLLMGGQLTHAQAETVITACDYQHVSKALETGGSIVMDCDRVLEVWSNRPLTIVADTTLKPAEGRTVTFKALNGRVFVVNAGVTLTLANLKISGKGAAGGGIENTGGVLNVSNIVFDDNDDSAIRNLEGGQVVVSDSLFSNNQTAISGGAIYNADAGTVTVSNSSFITNKSRSNSSGGAIYNLGTMTITGSTFNKNVSEGQFGGGGAVLNTDEGVLTVQNATFANNSADQSGGAVRNSGKGQMQITFSTFVDNNSGTLGGAIYSEGGDGLVAVKNSLFSGNRSNGKENDCQTQANTSGLLTNNNLSAFGCDVIAATGIATLSDNGGLTQTVALASDSNAIDAGVECTTDNLDGRGVARPQGERCDIGAYEFVPLTTAATIVGICQVTTTRNVRLRAEPNTASAILAAVAHNSTFQALEQVDGWYHITYGTVDGWVSAEFATVVGDCGG